MLEATLSGERILSGPEKAAALLLMLGPPSAGRILKHFDQPDLRVVARAAAGLGAVPAVTLDRLTDEFAADFSVGVNLLGDASRARTLLADALPPREVDDLLGVAADEGSDVWRSARQHSGTLHYRLLAGREACHRDLPSFQARPSARGQDRQRPSSRPPQCSAVWTGCAAGNHSVRAQLVERALRGFLDAAKTQAPAEDGRQRIAGIINNLEPEEAADVMRAIGEARPKDAAVIKTMLFSFNDLPRLPERARALLFDRASIDIVVMALRGTDPDFRNSILSSMPSRGRRLVEAELASGMAAPARDVAKARKAIAEIVLGMAARNEIELAVAADEAA